jgi:excisionase family DNA binding protein
VDTEQISAANVKSFADIDDAAAFLNVPKSWLYQRTRKNAVPFVRVGKYVRFDLPALADWAKAGCPAEWE